MSFDTDIPYLTRQLGLVTGCTPVSPGCDHCYARRLARRWGHDFVPTMHPELLDAPTRWRKPQVVGVCFHGDLFHRDVTDEFILKAFVFMLRTPQHTYVVPTKRAKRMADFHEQMHGPAPANIWWLVSVENQARAEERIHELLRVRGCTGVSLAPQIGPVDLDALDRPRIGWVVQECESGPRRRPFDLAWARQVRDACARAGVPYYLKQVQGCTYDDCHCWETDNTCGREPGHPCEDHRDRTVIKHPLLDGMRHEAVPWMVPA